MSAHTQEDHDSQDPLEAVTRYIPVVLPLAGAILIFLLAFIAVAMA
ncbi:hypothetical protein [Ottowia sp.]